MKRWIIASIFPFAAMSNVVAQDMSLFDSALAQVGMTHDDVHFDQTEMATWGTYPWVLSFFTMTHTSPFKLPKYGRINLEGLTANCGNITALITDAGRKIDCPIRRNLIGDPLEKYLDSSKSLPIPSLSQYSKLLSEAQFDRLRQKLDLFYSVIDDQESYFTLAYHGLSKADYQTELFKYFVSDSTKFNDTAEALASRIDFNRMVAGAEDIAEALRRLSDSLELLSFPASLMKVETKRGLIILGSKGNDDYSYTTPPLLILDPGGDDTYRISGSPNRYPVSAIIDEAGNDRYISSDSTSPGIGGAILGMSVVIDKNGDDVYDSKNVALGCGILGVGVVVDNNGNDHYRSKNFAQGAATFGIGILSDSTGNDSLYCWANSQGYGYTKGCGLCVNYSGNDAYIAEDSIIFSPGQQTKDHNSSLAQGVGFGKRADYIDGHSWAGGIGILCDITGDDRYSAGLFAQGCGYWLGLGMLIDGAGHDDYESAWYTLGSGAHYAVGYLDDFQGDDHYNATMNMSIGSGHDFTVGYFNERSGNDVYEAPGLSLGGGNFQGIGIFDDWSGNDTYHTSGGFNLGGARGLLQGPRAFLYTFGIFVDRGGDNSYSDARIKNGMRWISPKSDTTKPDEFEIGVGISK